MLLLFACRLYALYLSWMFVILIHCMQGVSIICCKRRQNSRHQGGQPVPPAAAGLQHWSHVPVPCCMPMLGDAWICLLEPGAVPRSDLERVGTKGAHQQNGGNRSSPHKAEDFLHRTLCQCLLAVTLGASAKLPETSRAGSQKRH